MARVELLEAETLAMAPLVLPPGWRMRDDIAHGAYSVRDNISVIWSAELVDGQRWNHLSVSCVNRLPDYEMLVRMKRWFLGRASKAIQVIPRQSEYVNHCQYCLHLWSPVGFDPLPDFRREGMI